MGIYLYTMRKERRVADFNGESVTVWAYKYARKVAGSVFRKTPPWEVRQDNAALDAFYQYEKNGKGLVATGFEPGEPVYREATRAVWYDTDKFPGELIGFIHADGRGRLTVKEFSPWELVQPLNEQSLWRREKAVDGKLIQEHRPYRIGQGEPAAVA